MRRAAAFHIIKPVGNAIDKAFEESEAARMKKRPITKTVVAAFFAALILCLALSAYIEYGRRQREDDQMKFIAGTATVSTRPPGGIREG